jgi:hypothetical protein
MQITIMTPKRGPRRFDISNVSKTLKVVRTIEVTDPGLPSMQIERYAPYAVGATTEGKSQVEVPTIVFPMNSTVPEEFVQTVTTCNAARPVLNVETETWRGFYDILYRGTTPDLHQKHTVYIALLRGRNAVLVVPAEHPQAANIIYAYRDQLITHEGSPVAVEFGTLAGDGFWRKSRTLLSSSLWSLLFHDSEVLAHVDEFFVPASTQAEGSTTTAGTRRPRTVSVQETPAVPVVERQVRPRHTLGGGKGLMSVASADINHAQATRSFARGMTTEATNPMRISSLLRVVMDDQASDKNDVVFAASAITTIRSHLTGPDFLDFIKEISMADGVPIVASPHPAQTVAERVVDVASSYGRSVVDALNMLADLM